MASDTQLAGVEALATRVKQLLWVVLDSMPAELVSWSLMLVRLLHAADTFPRGGLYDGHYAAQAALRYELFWLPLAARAQRSRTAGHVLVPPLDVALAWLLHRCTAPGSYQSECEALLGRVLDAPPAQAFRFAGAHAYTACESPEERQAWGSREVWDAAYTHTRGGGRAALEVLLLTPTQSAPASPGPGSEEPSPRPELRPAPGAGAGAGPGAGGSPRGTEGSWTGSRRSARGGGSSSKGAMGDGGKLAGSSSVGGSAAAGVPLQAQFWPPAPRGSRWDLTRVHPPRPQLAQSGEGYHSMGGSAGGGGGGSGSSVVSAIVGDVAAGGTGRGVLAGSLAGRMGELVPLLHSLLRPAYLDPDVLAQAVQRYCRFLMLQGMHPSVPMVPTTDIALMWVAHMAVPSAYVATCRRLLGRTLLPAPGVLRLEDGGADFAETRRLYEHHFGEVYDPPLTRAVPLSTPHPLLSTPLAPFFSAFEAAPTSGPQPVLAAAYFDHAGPASPTTRQLLQQRQYGNGGGEYGEHGRAGDGGDGGADAGGGLHRAGAHALYLAYLLRRGGSRSSRSLLGLMLGQAHRRRAAVKYVGNKAAGFRNFLHLPHSDSHPYWRKLRLRSVDPGSVPSAATSTSGAAVSQLGHDVEQQMDELIGGDADSDADDDDNDADGGNHGRNGRRRGEEDARQHEVVRQELARAAAAAAAAATAATAAAAAAAAAGPPAPRSGGSDRTPSSGGTAGGGGGFLTPVERSRRNSWMDPSSGTAPELRSGPPSASSAGSAGGRSGPPPPPPPPGPGPMSSAAGRRGAQRTGGTWERPKRIALIVPLPLLPPPRHSTLTLMTGSGTPSRRSSAADDTTSSGGPSERPSWNPRTTGSGAAPPPPPPLPDGRPAHAHMASAAAAAEPAAEVPTVDLAAGLAAAAVAAKAPIMAWAAPRHPPPRPAGSPAQGPLGAEGAAAPTAAAGDVAAPSPLRRPSIERRKYEDGTDEWSYNNPYFSELGALSPMSPMSPLGQTPPPASATFLAAAAAAGKSGGTAATPAAAVTAAVSQEHAGRGFGFGGEVWAVRVAPPTDTRDGAGAPGDGEGGGGAEVVAGDGCGGSGSDHLQSLRSGSLVAADDGGGSGGSGDGSSSRAAPESAYASCPNSEEERAPHSGDAPSARKRSSDGGGESVYSTPTAAFAASVVTPFGPDGREGGDGAAAAAATAAAPVVVTGTATIVTAAAAAAAGPTINAGAGGVFAGGGGGGLATATIATRTSAPSISRLARVTTASPLPVPAPSLTTTLAPPAAAMMTSAASGGNGGSSAARPSGLPPRPVQPFFSPPPPRSGGGSGSSNAAAAAAPPLTPKRASGTFSATDVSYMGSLGGVASLVTRGEESPVFSMSLREQYTAGRSTGGAPASVGSAAGRGSGSGGADGGSSAGFSTPPVSSSGASFCSAVSGRSGGRGWGTGGAAGR